MDGSVRFGGADITGQPAERITRRGLLHVPEGRGIFPNLRVDESLRLAAALAKLDSAEANRRVDDAYTTFPSLERRRTQAAGTLSGGEQQMLALARALIGRPRLLMVDEMSQGLAPAIVDRLFEIVKAFRDNGTALILVEQFVTRALAVADRHGFARTVVDTAPQIVEHVISEPHLYPPTRQLTALITTGLKARKRAAPAPRRGKLLDPLTTAEIRVLEKLSERLTYTEIAADLYLSLNTVKTHLRHAYMKLGVTSRSSAVRRATSLGIL